MCETETAVHTLADLHNDNDGIATLIQILVSPRPEF